MVKDDTSSYKLPDNLKAEISNLIRNPVIKEKYKFNSIREFLDKAVSKYIEEVKLCLPEKKIAKILKCLGY